MMNMRNTGMLSARAAESFLSMAASAQKLGVGKEVEEINQALTGGLQNFINLDPFMKTMMVQGASAGGLDMKKDIWSGDIGNSPEKMKKMVDGLDKSFSRAAGVTDILKTNIDEMDPKKLADANNQIQIMSHGKYQGIAQLKRALQAMDEGSQTFSDKLQKLDDQFKDTSKTTQERMNIEKQRKDLMIHEASTVLNSYSEAIKNAGSLDKALNGTKIKKIIDDNRQGIETALKLKPGESKGMDPQKLMEGLGQVKLEGLKGLSKESHIKMKIDPKQIQGLMKTDPSKAIEMLEKENKRIATEEEARTDPVKAAQLKIMKLNQSMRIISAMSMGYLFAIMGSTGIMASWITGVGGKQLLGAVGSTAKGLAGLGKSLFTAEGRAGMGKHVAKGIHGISKEFEGMDEDAWFGLGKQFKKLGGSLKGLIKLAPEAASGVEATAQATNILASTSEVASAGMSTFATTSVIAGEGIADAAAATEVAAASAGIAEVEAVGLSQAWNPVGWVILGVTAAIVLMGAGIKGVISAFEAGDHAAEIFGKTQKELTLNQIWAAEGAGLLTGALNFLTFGIFRKSLGPTGTLTQSLAHLFEAFPLLSWAIQTFVMAPIKIVIGVFKGLYHFVKNIFIGIWDALKIVLSSFDPIFDAISEVVKVFSEAFGGFGIKAEGTVGIIELLVDILGGLGTAVGWVFKVIAYGIKAFIWPFAWAIGAVMKIIGTAAAGIWSAIAPVVNSLMRIFVGLGNILSGIFTLNFSKIVKGLGQVLVGVIGFAINNFLMIPMAIINGITGAIKAIVKIIWSSVKFLFSTLPQMAWDAIKAVGAWFMGLPAMIGSAISSWVDDFISDISTQFGFLGSVLSYLLVPIKWIAKAFMWVGGIISNLVKGIIGVFQWLYDALIGHSIVTDLIFGIIKFFALLPFKILGALGNLVMQIPGLIWEGIKGIGRFALRIPSLIWEGVKGIGSLIWKGIVSCLPGFVQRWLGVGGDDKKGGGGGGGGGGGIIGGAIGAVGSVAGAIAGAVGSVITAPFKLVGKAVGAVTGAAGWVWSKGKGLLGNLLGKTGISRAASFLGAVFNKGTGIVSSLFGKVYGNKAAGLMMSGVQKFIRGDIFGAMRNVAAGLWEGAKTVGSTLWGGMKFVGSTLWGGVKAVGSWLWDGVKSVGSTLWSGVKTVGAGIAWVGEKAYDGVKNGLTWVGNKLSDGAKWIGDKAADGASWVADKAKAFAGSIADGVSWVADKAKAFAGSIADGASWVADKAKAFVDGIASGTKWIGDKLAEGAKWISDGVASLANALVPKVEGGNKNPITGNTAWWQTNDSIVKDAKKQADAINAQHDVKAESNQWMESHQDVVRRLRQENGLDPDTGKPIAVATPVENASAALKTNAGATNATKEVIAKPLAQTIVDNKADITDQMKKEQVGAEPDVTEVGGEELSDIAKYSENLDLLQDILDTLKEMKESQSMPDLTGIASTMTPMTHIHKPVSPPNFHRLPTGSYSQGPNRQVINRGQ
jgi:hypothetical protein